MKAPRIGETKYGFNSSLIIEERLHTLIRSVHLAKLLVLVLGIRAALLAFEEGLAVLIELEGGDDTVAGVDGKVGLLGVELLTNDFLNIKASAAAVDGLDLTFTSLHGSADNLNRVTLADGDCTDSVLILKVSAEVAGHHSAANA